MTTYNGPVIIMAKTGTEHPAKATLQTGTESNLQTWRGTVDLDFDTLIQMVGDNVTMRLPDGQEGSVLVKNTVGEVVGSGPAPFA